VAAILAVVARLIHNSIIGFMQCSDVQDTGPRMHFVKNKYHERPERNGAMLSVPGMLILDSRPSDQKILNRLIKFNTIAPAFTF
jgi:hypothetical protein